MQHSWILVWTFALSIGACIILAERSFVVNRDKNTFVKDGQSFNYVSGSMHYSRIPYYYWKDRLQKMRAAGLDAVQTYVPWNVHEPFPGVYDFNQQQDIVEFIKEAQAVGLLVILRAGPYICAEWEFGGFPPWLLRNNGSVVLRTMDPAYIKPVEQWFSVLLPKIEPLLYKNDGPVIMVQVENEYGSYFACDYTYTNHLRGLFYKYLGEDALLFTTDGNGLNFLKCGAIHNTFTTVDFGPVSNISKAFAAMKQWNGNRGPLVNSEFYVGWLDYWGRPHANVDVTNVCRTLDDILRAGANVNMYMFEGGTSFGYMNGADPPFNVCPTSYDYDAPLTEAGDITLKYLAIRQVIAKYKPMPDVPFPSNTIKRAYGPVPMNYQGSVLELLDNLMNLELGSPIKSIFPLSMEQVKQNYGFILYRTVLPNSASNGSTSTLQIPGLRDRAHVLVNDKTFGILQRQTTTELQIFWDGNNQILNIFVENQGRINFGSQINFNRKGIISNVTLDNSTLLMHWEIYPLNFTRLFDASSILAHDSFNNSAEANKPGVFSGTFVISNQTPQPAITDTFLRLDGWSKGQAFLNGFNLGRYWPDKGPQITLYVPYKLLNPYPKQNRIVLVELDYTHRPCKQRSTCMIEFVDTPKLNSTVPSSKKFVKTIHADYESQHYQQTLR